MWGGRPPAPDPSPRSVPTTDGRAGVVRHLGDFHAFDPRALAWRSLPPAAQGPGRPPAAFAAAAAVLPAPGNSDSLFVFGGVTAQGDGRPDED